MSVKTLSCFLLWLVFCSASEPRCSRFDYEEKMLEKVIRVQFELEQLSKKFESFGKFENVSEELTNLKFDLELFKLQATNSLDTIRSEAKQRHSDYEQEQRSILVRLEETERNVTKAVNKLKGHQQPESTAFTAYLDHKQHLNKDEHIHFNEVLLNLGNMYNPENGVFTVPVTGHYLLSFHIEHWETPELPVALMVNGELQVNSVLNAKGTSLQSGVTVVLSLRKGQRVWVEAQANGELYGSSTFRGTTFSGVFLF